MIEIARQEGDEAAERSFRYANEVEIIHAELYRKALRKWSQWKRLTITCAQCVAIPARTDLPRNVRCAMRSPKHISGWTEGNETTTELVSGSFDFTDFARKGAKWMS
jgi:rubrerythrin